MISVLPRMPVTDRLIIAIGVISKVLARIASAMPGTSLSSTAKQASGVTSYRPSPVPPVDALIRTGKPIALAAPASFFGAWSLP